MLFSNSFEGLDYSIRHRRQNAYMKLLIITVANKRKN